MTYFWFGWWRYTFFMLTNQNHCYMPKLNDLRIYYTWIGWTSNWYLLISACCFFCCQTLMSNSSLFLTLLAALFTRLLRLMSPFSLAVVRFLRLPGLDPRILLMKEETGKFRELWSPTRQQIKLEVGQRSPSRSRHGTTGKVLSQGTHMPSIKALSIIVQKLWPKLKFLWQTDTGRRTNEI